MIWACLPSKNRLAEEKKRLSSGIPIKVDEARQAVYRKTEDVAKYMLTHGQGSLEPIPEATATTNRFAQVLTMINKIESTAKRVGQRVQTALTPGVADELAQDGPFPVADASLDRISAATALLPARVQACQRALKQFCTARDKLDKSDTAQAASVPPASPASVATAPSAGVGVDAPAAASSESVAPFTNLSSAPADLSVLTPASAAPAAAAAAAATPAHAIAAAGPADSAATLPAGSGSPESARGQPGELKERVKQERTAFAAACADLGLLTKEVLRHAALVSEAFNTFDPKRKVEVGKEEPAAPASAALGPGVSAARRKKEQHSVTAEQERLRKRVDVCRRVLFVHVLPLITLVHQCAEIAAALLKTIAERAAMCVDGELDSALHFDGRLVRENFLQFLVAISFGQQQLLPNTSNLDFVHALLICNGLHCAAAIVSDVRSRGARHVRA